MKRRFALLALTVSLGLACNTLQNLAPQPTALVLPSDIPTQIPLPTSSPQPTVTLTVVLPTSSPQPTTTPAIIAPVVATPIVKATSSWDRYEPRKLADIINKYQKSVDADRVGYYLPNEFPASRVKMMYMGLYRPMSKSRAVFLYFGLGSLKADPDYIKLFEQEMLLIEDNVEYWLPVQTPLIPYFEKEVKKGGDVLILTIWVGTIISEKDKDWIFLVNEFNR